MKKIYTVSAGIVVIFLSLLTLLLHVQAQPIIKALPTPSPYKPPLRSEELPQSTHRAQSLLATSIATNFNPWGIAVDALNGIVWVAEPGCDAAPTCPQSAPTMLGKFSQADGQLIQEYQQPMGYSNPLFLAIGSDSKVWFTQPNTDAIGAFDPETTNFFSYRTAKNSAPYDLVIDKNGNIWFTEFNKSAIGFLNTQTHALVETTIPTPDSDPYGITIDPKGIVWFVENEKGLGQIGSFTPTLSGKISITEHRVNAVQPHLIIADKIGNIWFSEASAGNIGRYNPANGTTTSYQVTPPCLTRACHGVHISGIAVDQSGHIWFTDSLASVVGYLNPANGAVTKKIFADPNAHPHDGLVIDQENTVWFTLEFGRSLNMWPNAKIPAK